MKLLLTKFKPEALLRALGVIAVVAVSWLALLPAGKALAFWSYDLAFVPRTNLKSDGVEIVYIDPESHESLGQSPLAPWDRSLHIRLLERLAADQAAAVVFDFEFFDPWPDPAVDVAFAAAMKKMGKVVIGSSFDFAGQAGAAEGIRWVEPLALFTEAGAISGVVQTEEDSDGTIRRHLAVPGRAHPSLSSAPAILGGWRDANPEQVKWLNFYGPPGTLKGVSYSRALTNDLPPGYFRNKTVFVGAKPSVNFAGSFREEFRTPFTFWTGRYAPGVEIHATSYLNLVQGNWLKRFPVWLEMVVLIMTGSGLALGLARLRPWSALGAVLLTVLVIPAIALLLVWKTGFWFSWLSIVVLQAPLALFWSLHLNLIQSFLERRSLEQSLELHLSPSRVQEIMGRPELLRPGAVERRISILFSDIANFSKITERMLPEDLVRLLNNYFEATLGVIYEADGTVVKLIGDAIFAIWNAPLDQANHQKQVCHAALRLREQLVHFDTSHDTLPLRTRVGLHTGLANVGNFGSTKRFDFTAIGQSVNLASRLEGLNKHLGTDILATRDIQASIESEIVSRSVGFFRFKGFDRVIEVYELVGTKSCEMETKEWRESFSESLRAFQRRDFTVAEAGFKRTIELRAEEGVSRFYLQVIAELRATPPEPDWAGEVDLKEK